MADQDSSFAPDSQVGSSTWARTASAKEGLAVEVEVAMTGTPIADSGSSWAEEGDLDAALEAPALGPESTAKRAVEVAVLEEPAGGHSAGTTIAAEMAAEATAEAAVQIDTRSCLESGMAVDSARRCDNPVNSEEGE